MIVTAVHSRCRLSTVGGPHIRKRSGLNGYGDHISLWRSKSASICHKTVQHNKQYTMRVLLQVAADAASCASRQLSVVVLRGLMLDTAFRRHTASKDRPRGKLPFCMRCCFFEERRAGWTGEWNLPDLCMALGDIPFNVSISTVCCMSIHRPTLKGTRTHHGSASLRRHSYNFYP